jgi:hypothetical protein
MRDPNESSYLQVRMTNQLRNRLDAEAHKRGIKATELTRALILGFCERQAADEAEDRAPAGMVK